MRKRVVKKGITVNAIAGTYVVFLGLDIEPKMRKGFRGFAIKREDHTEGETIWLRGLKTFEAVEPTPAQGETFSSYKHPIQGFQWSDYSAKAGYDYTYTICCMYGPVDDVKPKYQVSVSVTTEVEDIGKGHSVFFNRGSVATQEYARKFLNKKPKDVGPAAYEWLSRGMLESIIRFIDKAKKGDSIFGAVYEFQWPAIYDALKNAKSRGVKVDIIYDATEGKKGPFERNEEGIEIAKIKSITSPRKNGKLMHNKFFIHSRGDKNLAVLTGSTNQTENGLYGHSNLVHIVEDKQVANAFKDYWDRLKEDPAIAKEYRDANMDATPVLETLPKGTTVIFSPRGTKLDSLDWYAKLASEAKGALLMTFAFGMHQKFKDVFSNDDDILKMALMEKAYAPAVKEKDTKAIQKIRNRPNVIIAIGNRIATNAFDRWLREIDRIIPTLHVHWIHTKYMIIDPIGPNPIIVSGSANYSKASTDTNDENMLLIKGDKRVADIYFGEYLRLFNHYSFRESVKRALDLKEIGVAEEWTPQFLETKDSWMDDYFNDTNDKTARFARRVYFSGPMSE